MITRTSDIIYGLEHQDKIFYIGKLTKNKSLTKSSACSQYTNPLVRTACSASGVKMICLKTVEDKNWYDQKLSEVVAKHKDKHPLLNQQWMLEGKRGYWQDRKRDVHTLSRLSESKFKKVCEYDSSTGVLIKTWSSGKEIALTVIGDYRVIKGGGDSIIYNIINKGGIKTHLYNNRYWFKEEELIKAFTVVPKKLNIPEILAWEKRQAKASREAKASTYKTRTEHQVYSITDMRDPVNPITYPTVADAAYHCKATVKTIARLCCDGVVFKYSGKTSQPVKVSYPAYDVEISYAGVVEQYYGMEKIRVGESESKYKRSKTSTSVNLYVDNVISQTWMSCSSCGDELNLTSDRVRYLCSGCCKNPEFDLRYGEKIKRYL